MHIDNKSEFDDVLPRVKGLSVPASVIRTDRKIVSLAFSGFAGVFALAITLLMLFHAGFIATDDASYLSGALGWLQHFPYVGDSHWTLRHTITLPTAILVSTLGLNEFAVVLPNVLYFLAFLAVNAYFVTRYAGRQAAIATLLLLSTMPGFLVVATYLNTDIPELFFLSSAFWMLSLAFEFPGRQMPWFVIGVLSGLAFLTRETSVIFLLFLGLLFLVYPIVPRKHYFVAAAGFLPVVLGEWAYLFAMTGNPLYRWSIDFFHDRIDRFAQVASVASRGGLIDGEGNIAINVYLDPIINLFISQKYGLLFLFALPAFIFLWRRRYDTKLSRMIFLLACFGGLSFTFVAWNPRLYLVPRYFLVVSWAAAVIVGVWLSTWQRGNRARLTVTLGLAVAVNLAALMVENTNPRYVERMLVRFVKEHPDVAIHTDLETALRSRFFFEFEGISPDRVSAAEPALHSLFFYSADRVSKCAQMPRCREVVQTYRPRSGWVQVSTIQPAPPLIARLAIVTGLDRLLSPDIARRVLSPRGAIQVYRVE